MDVGVGFGPILLGTIISAVGYTTMYWILAGFVVVAGAVYFLVHGRTDAAKARLSHFLIAELTPFHPL